MRLTITLTCLLLSTLAFSQAKPTYCEELPVTYEKGAWVTRGGDPRTKLPEYPTQPVKEYKIQVAILKFTSPADFSFHPKLVARYRPCEEVWVIESRESFRDRNEAEKLRKELEKSGYKGCYITELLGYY